MLLMKLINWSSARVTTSGAFRYLLTQCHNLLTNDMPNSPQDQTRQCSRETAKHPKPISQTPQAPVRVWNFKVHDSTARKRLKSVWVVWKGCQKKTSSLLKEHVLILQALTYCDIITFTVSAYIEVLCGSGLRLCKSRKKSLLQNQNLKLD